MSHIKSIIALVFACIAVISCKQTQKTSNGMEYVHVVSNNGPKPAEEDKISFHMTIKTDTDSLLTSTYMMGQEQQTMIPPASYPMTKPDPFLEVFKKMSVGDSLILTIPVDSMPSRNGIPEKAKAIVYGFKMTKITSKAEIEANKAKYQAEGAKVLEQSTSLFSKLEAGSDPSVLKTASGIKYVVHSEGKGPKANMGETVKVMYSGILKDGKEFDSSFKRGEPIQFPAGVGQVIKGWDEMITTLPKGSKATIFVPYALAYGEAGSPPMIPAKSDLVFYIEILE
ncbi:MAG: FKBP-type peptidyl-prolyl cis-trans isomerase [Saprospiraceae bacterium]|jgi:FKBP-type peptidyl-prolyl cis-trans isomerase|nr:FKBP-type peptidyl-prolyl cis-trans isomerase [Saprospiraceae bacterium]